MLDIGKRLRIVLGALALAFAALAATLQAAPEVYVASAGDHSTGAGWSTAFTNVQAAIDAVDDGGSIHLKGETFTITNQLTWIGGADVTLRGGYQGVGVPGPRDPRQWPTTLQLAPGYESRVLYAEGVDNGVIESIRFAGGNRRGRAVGDAGGGLCLSNNLSMTLRDCIITNNLAEKFGGGLAIIGTASGYAGPTMIDQCVIAANRAVLPSTDYPSGGGLYAYYASTITMTDCRIVTNNVHGTGPYGGGMFLLRATVNATRTLLADNWLSGGGYFRGGAAQVSSLARLNLDGCIVRNNRCIGGSNARGAGICTDSSSSFYFRNTLFHGNIASGTATYGGAICYYTGNNLTIDNCTFADNAPTAIDRQNVNGSIELNNCILWGNGEREIIDRGDSLKTTAYHCDIRDGFNNGTNNCFARDPRFMRPAAAQYQLRTHSPCREQGKALSWHTADGVDLAGNPRILPTKGIVDLGALEGLPLQATWLILR